MFDAQQDTLTGTTTVANGAALTVEAPDAAAGNTLDKRSDAVRMAGYLDAGGSDHHRRLHRTPGSELYVEIESRDIVDASSAAGDGDPTGGQSMIWVRRDALVVWHELMTASSFGASDLDEIVHWPRG
jgi:hypothetical protein